ncbi:di-heme oxidoredictase family protein [Chthonobacter albigriseus]|uniref:di-heme oxidoreductase family protein n=1 Tax=Chthonobacter albigriseus TaxID=1683161 RepID=UPI003CC7E04D
MRHRWALLVLTCLPAALLPVGVGLGNGLLAHREDLDDRDRARVAKVVAPAFDFTDGEPFEALAGGAATTRTVPTEDAFTQPSANLPDERRQTFILGHALFRKTWVSSPSSTQASDGLGPLFNARSCEQCHVRDGRSRAPGEHGGPGFVLRLSIPDGEGGTTFEPTYGWQLQDRAVPGLPAEGRVTATPVVSTTTRAGEAATRLEKRDYTITEESAGALHPETQISPRVASPMIGLGLLEAIHPGDILANADPDDRDGDGISGRPNIVEGRLGRFGWKAAEPDVPTQVAAAFSADLGLSTPLRPDPAGDCTPAQAACRSMPDGVQARLGSDEVPQDVLELVSFYARNVAVPVRRTVKDRTVLAGKQVFYEAGCQKCHTPKYVTRRDAQSPDHSFQLIWPYTDLLLHDMGDGLADNRPEGAANGREWRTPPLWGIGLTHRVEPDAGFLHDGRAKTLLEAVLWHGGEAEAARNHVASLDPDSRNALIAFLNSL